MAVSAIIGIVCTLAGAALGYYVRDLIAKAEMDAIRAKQKLHPTGWPEDWR